MSFAFEKTPCISLNYKLQGPSNPIFRIRIKLYAWPILEQSTKSEDDQPILQILTESE